MDRGNDYFFQYAQFFSAFSPLDDSTIAMDGDVESKSRLQSIHCGSCHPIDGDVAA
jgi:hypothetical protein